MADPKGELTQVEFWNLYKDAFLPFQDRQQLLVASDVIKNVTVVFPQAQAMVLEGPTNKFVVRGVNRRQVEVAVERFRCRWNRGQCDAAPFGSAGELQDHVSEHINTPVGEGEAQSEEGGPCQWATCSRGSLPKAQLRAHVLTHLPKSQPDAKHPGQGDSITLSSESSPYPLPDPTTRPPPPPRNAVLSYPVPLVDPPSSALTSLLCLRVLYRTAYAAVEAAPRVDSNHFGFPGIVEEEDDQEDAAAEALLEEEEEGARRGKKAFVRIRRLLGEVRIRDETLMGWITEMLQASL